MSGARRDRPFHPVKGTAAIMAIWGLRIMIFLGSQRTTRKGDEVIDLDDYEWKGLGLKPLKDGIRAGKFKRLARERLSGLIHQKPVHDRPFRRNIEMLTRCLGLNAVERQVFEFALLVNNHRYLSTISDNIPDDMAGFAKLDVTLATILGVGTPQISAALSSRNKLIMSGLIQLDRAVHRGFSDRFDMPEGLLKTIFEDHEDIFSLLRSFCPPARAPETTLKDFPHLAREIAWMTAYLEKGLTRKKKGINILLYGPPGTGKTELALNLARRCRAQCYEVAMSNEAGDSLPGESRFSSYRLAQSVLSNGERNVIVFDEIEDVFGDYDGGFIQLMLGGSGRASSKAWVNQTLENNPVPSIWVSNRVSNMDHAYLRRFDLVIEVGMPPRNVRKRILERHIFKEKKDMVSARWIDSITEYSHISPAMISRAARVVSEYGVAEPRQAEHHMEAMLNNWCKAMELPRVRVGEDMGKMTYRIELLNTTPPLEPLAAGLKRSGAGRLCLYGPPGTGKTAFGKHIAKTLDRPLLVKRTSDILSKWVGETEKNIAGMFEEAEREDAVLLLDEADSLLRDRRTARASWEVTQVNELLTQMENFPGIFICSTNLIDSLDEASLRRFDMKIRFDPMTAVQRWELFMQVLPDSSRADLRSWEHRVITELEGVTPGDYSMAVRQLRLMGHEMNEENLFQSLLEEARLKKGRTGRGIGFSAAL